MDTPTTRLPAPDPAVREAWRRARVEAACEQACRAIAPAWPLDQAIAVNPHWHRIDRPVREVAARLAVLSGARVFPPRALVRGAWDEGRIGAADLEEALAALPAAREAGLTASRCLEALREEPAVQPLPLLIDVLDDDPARHARLPWRQAVTHQVSQACAAWFDEHQADWQPARDQGLYAFWRDSLVHDRGIALLTGLPGLQRHLHALPATREAAERWVLERLDLPEAVWADYLEAVLLTVQGWASWCAWLAWQARLAGREDDAAAELRDLLAIRLAWGVILLECKDDASTRRAFAAVRAEWSRAPERLEAAASALLVDEAWQLALEAGYQRHLARELAQAPARPLDAVDGAPARPDAQAVFCIDVRSEPLRRALEAVSPGVRTAGFAGFFGVPAAYTPLGTEARRPQLPGLLAPSLSVTDRVVRAAAGGDDEARLADAVRRARARRTAGTAPWRAASRWPGAAFSFVEAAGLGHLGALARWLRPSSAPRPDVDGEGVPARLRPACRPALSGLDLSARTDLAAGALQALDLDAPLAPLVAFVGHGSHSANNAHAASLDCGACGGQSGEVNARVLAGLLNDPEVRAGLRARGRAVPDDTTFVAALHDTATDEITAFDLDLLPPVARARWRRLADAFAHAADQVRRERAPGLGLDAGAPHDALRTALRRRANDGAETRPEWGLAGNAALVIAPRWRTRGLLLAGRVFLHDHDPARDPEGHRLAQLLAAPMVVANWINWQYHASTCDPERFGSGNKLLHNVVGGRIGVFEGNGGDLRIGLSRQSLHDGERWVHEPLRLTVVVDAPREAIERVLRAHEPVRQLVDHGWLHLWRFEGEGLEQRAQGAWQARAA